MIQMLKQQPALLTVLTLLIPTAAAAEEGSAPDAPPPSEQPTTVATTDEGAPRPAAEVAQASETAPAPAEASAEEAPLRKMDLSTPPPPPARERKARMHNGFYLRGSFGAGGLWSNALDRSDSADTADMNGSAFALNFDAMAGGSPGEGFALGGGLSWMGGASDLSGDGQSLDTQLGMLLLGPFFDAFPDPKHGFHLGALVGYALHTIDDHPSTVDMTQGYGGAAWLGYDWWVANEISAGFLVKFSGALTQGDEGSGSLRLNSTALTVMGTALYH